MSKDLEILPQNTIASGVRMWIRSDNFLPSILNVYSSVFLQTISPFLAFSKTDLISGAALTLLSFNFFAIVCLIPLAETIVSRQPTPPQLQTLLLSSTLVCPNSPAYP